MQQTEQPPYKSISWPDTSSTDLLAVLYSAQKAGTPYTYLETPAQKSGVSSFGVCAQAAFIGKNRFEEAQRWAEQILSQMTYKEPPVFVCAFPFFENEPAIVRLPEYSVHMQDGEIRHIGCGRSNQALKKEDGWDDFKSTSLQEKNQDPKALEAVSDPLYKANVQKACQLIEEGLFEKIVLARALKYQTHRSPIEILHSLRNQHPYAHTFAFSNEKEVFLGASPEHLFCFKDNRLESEALAGSGPRGKTIAEDDALGRALLNSQKDLREHGYVVQSITQILQELGFQINAPSGPILKKFKNIQHLHTPIQASTVALPHPFTLIQALHPTPALGGFPKEGALSWIPKLESFKRGLYGGILGWFIPGKDSEWIVGIRSGKFAGNEATLYAGCGIVRGSDPEKELQETHLKLQALAQHL